MVERIPLAKQISYDIWKNVRKLGSDFYPVITINFPNLRSGEYYETEVIDTYGWIGLIISMTTNTTLKVEILSSHDGVNFFEYPPYYVPPNTASTFRSNISERYFKLRITNIGVERLNGSATVTLRPYPLDLENIPRRSTLYTFNVNLGRDGELVSPVFDTDLIEEFYLTVYSDRQPVLITIEGSPDKTNWYVIYQETVNAGVHKLISQRPALRYIRFRIQNTGTGGTRVIGSFTVYALLI